MSRKLLAVGHARWCLFSLHAQWDMTHRCRDEVIWTRKQAEEPTIPRMYPQIVSCLEFPFILPVFSSTYKKIQHETPIHLQSFVHGSTMHREPDMWAITLLEMYIRDTGTCMWSGLLASEVWEPSKLPWGGYSVKHSAYLSTQLQGKVSVAKLGNKSLVARLMAIINPRRACTVRVTVHVVVLCVFVCVSVCPSQP